MTELWRHMQAGFIQKLSVEQRCELIIATWGVIRAGLFLKLVYSRVQVQILNTVWSSNCPIARGTATPIGFLYALLPMVVGLELRHSKDLHHSHTRSNPSPQL